MTHLLAQSTIIFFTRAESQIYQEAGQKPEVALVVCAFLYLSLSGCLGQNPGEAADPTNAGSSGGIIGE